MMYYVLTLVFACTVDCGEPALVVLPQHYNTVQECTKVGLAWLSPNANPSGAIETFNCERHVPPTQDTKH